MAVATVDTTLVVVVVVVDDAAVVTVNIAVIVFDLFVLEGCRLGLTFILYTVRRVATSFIRANAFDVLCMFDCIWWCACFARQNKRKSFFPKNPPPIGSDRDTADRRNFKRRKSARRRRTSTTRRISSKSFESAELFL